MWEKNNSKNYSKKRSLSVCPLAIHQMCPGICQAKWQFTNKFSVWSNKKKKQQQRKKWIWKWVSAIQTPIKRRARCHKKEQFFGKRDARCCGFKSFVCERALLSAHFSAEFNLWIFDSCWSVSGEHWNRSSVWHRYVVYLIFFIEQWSVAHRCCCFFCFADFWSFDRVGTIRSWVTDWMRLRQPLHLLLLFSNKRSKFHRVK